MTAPWDLASRRWDMQRRHLEYYIYIVCLHHLSVSAVTPRHWLTACSTPDFQVYQAGSDSASIGSLRPISNVGRATSNGENPPLILLLRNKIFRMLLASGRGFSRPRKLPAPCSGALPVPVDCDSIGARAREPQDTPGRVVTPACYNRPSTPQDPCTAA